MIITGSSAALARPERGRAERALRSDLRSMSAGSHRIYYSAEGDTLTVRRVLHKAMDGGRWLGCIAGTVTGILGILGKPWLNRC